MSFNGFEKQASYQTEKAHHWALFQLSETPRTILTTYQDEHILSRQLLDRNYNPTQQIETLKF